MVRAHRKQQTPTVTAKMALHRRSTPRIFVGVGFERVGAGEDGELGFRVPGVCGEDGPGRFAAVRAVADGFVDGFAGQRVGYRVAEAGACCNVLGWRGRHGDGLSTDGERDAGR